MIISVIIWSFFYFEFYRYDKPIETVQDLVDSKLPWGATHDAWIFSIRLTQELNTKILLGRFQTPSFDFLKGHGKTRDFAYSVERLPGGILFFILIFLKN